MPQSPFVLSLRLIRIFTGARGTGASCIYALLACAQRPSWEMAATGACCYQYLFEIFADISDSCEDVDDKNIRYARHNVQKNGLDKRIRVIQTTGSDPLIPIPYSVPIGG